MEAVRWKDERATTGRSTLPGSGYCRSLLGEHLLAGQPYKSIDASKLQR